MGQNERNLRFVGSMPHGSSALFHPTPFYPANQKHIAPAIAATSIQSLLLREVEAGLGLAGLVSMWPVLNKLLPYCLPARRAQCCD